MSIISQDVKDPVIHYVIGRRTDEERIHFFKTYDLLWSYTPKHLERRHSLSVCSKSRTILEKAFFWCFIGLFFHWLNFHKIAVLLALWLFFFDRIVRRVRDIRNLHSVNLEVFFVELFISEEDGGLVPDAPRVRVACQRDLIAVATSPIHGEPNKIQL